MIFGQRRAGLWLAALLLVLPAATSLVAAFSVNPMTVELTPSGSGTVASFKIENDSTDPIALVVSVLTRSVDKDGIEQNDPVGLDFVVLPSRVILEPQSSRIVKVQWRGSPHLESERAFRVVVEQVPVVFSETSVSGIHIMFRYRASLYVVPTGAHASLILEALKPALREGQAGFIATIHNSGDKHGIIKTARLMVHSSAQNYGLSDEALSGLIGMNILARSRRDVFIPWASASMGTVYEGVFSTEHE